MEKLPHYYFSWIVSSRNREKCEMLPLETKQSGGKLSVVKKSIYSDRIIAVKFKAETVSILIVQVYMLTLEYEDDEVEELYEITEEILEEDGKGATNTM
jgi:hypothetical protein